MSRKIQNRTKKSALLKWLLGVIIVFSIIQSILGIVLGMSRVIAGETLLNNMRIDGIDVGGMTKEECQKALKSSTQKKLDNVKISIQAEEHQTTWSAKDLGVTMNTAQLIENASTRTEKKGILDRYNEAAKKERIYRSEFMVDKKTMDKTVSDFLNEAIDGGVSSFEKKQVEEKVVAAVKKGKHTTINVTNILKQKDKEVLHTLPKGNVLLAKYTTESESDKSRDSNLKTFCDAINGAKVKSGDVFSIFEQVGELTEEKGYVNAKVIVNQTQLADGIGGGVCQVVTTLYNAALLSDMEITDRSRHSFPVDYVPVGMDAMINWPETDFAIRNISDDTIYIYAEADGGNVQVSIYGMPMPEGQKIKTVAEVSREIKPGKEQVVLSKELPEDEKKVKQEARTGYEVQVYREYYQNGILGTREEISHDIYPAVNKVVLMGSSGKNK